MEQKPAFAGVKLEARYHRRVPNDKIYKGILEKYVTMVIPPDGGEVENHDYLLRQLGYPQVLCAAEVEYGKEVVHVTEDLGKLLAVRSPLKVMVYRMDYPRKSPPQIEFAKRKRAIEAMIAAEGHDHPQEDWLFIGYPYYPEPYPKRKEETFVRLYTLSTPCKSVSLVEPDWDIWQPDPDMDRWFHSLYPPAGGATRGV